MVRHYSYRMKQDKGFAPNTEYDICTLSGCKNSKSKKRRNIEELAEPGSWVIGIGGIKTKKPDKLIYAMEVEKNLLYREFKKKYPRKSKYLRKKAGTNVLVSRKFYYFGDKAINLQGLESIIIKCEGCKCVSDEDLNKLKKLLAKYPCGRHGRPNNLSGDSNNCGGELR